MNRVWRRPLAWLRRNKTPIVNSAAIVAASAVGSMVLSLAVALVSGIAVALIWGVDYWRAVGTIASVAWIVLFIVIMMTQWYWPSVKEP